MEQQIKKLIEGIEYNIGNGQGEISWEEQVGVLITADDAKILVDSIQKLQYKISELQAIIISESNGKNMIKKITDKSFWYKWLFGKDGGYLHTDKLSEAVKELTEKVNELVDGLNTINRGQDAEQK